MKNTSLVVGIILILVMPLYCMSVCGPEAIDQVNRLIEYKESNIIHTADRFPELYVEREKVAFRVRITFLCEGYYDLKIADFYEVMPKLKAWEDMSDGQKEICEIGMQKYTGNNASLRATEQYRFFASSRKDVSQLVLALVEYLEKYREDVIAELPGKIEETDEQIVKLTKKKEKLEELRDMALEAREQEWKTYCLGKEQLLSLLAGLNTELSLCNANKAEIEAKIDGVARLIAESEKEETTKMLKIKKSEYEIEYAGKAAQAAQLRKEIEKAKAYLVLDKEYSEYRQKASDLGRDLSDLRSENRRYREHLGKLKPVISDNYYVTQRNISVEVNKIVWEEE